MGFDNVNVNVSGGQSIIKALQNYNTVILKPNIVDNRNVLTQEMMSERHTKYIIRWNYSLEGATINVPEDCIVEFTGGTIDNGTIVGNNTMLMYSKPIDEVCLAERQGTFIYNTTVADEEDITSASGQLKFKDRPSTDGMGRKILRKNIVDGVNTLTQSIINQPNTIYVIQYDFTLGEDITVPANCILQFDGGSISGEFTMTGNSTFIKSEAKGIILCGVQGTFCNTTIYPDIFIPKNSNTITQIIINKVLSVAKIVTFKQNETYTFDNISIDNCELIGLKTNILFGGNNDCLITCGNNTIIDGFVFNSSNRYACIVYVDRKDNITIKNCKFVATNFTDGDQSTAEEPITIKDTSNIYIDNCSFIDGWNDHNYDASNYGGSNLGNAIWIFNHLEENVTIKNCYAKNVWSFCKVINASNVFIKNNHIENTADTCIFDRCTSGITKNKHIIGNTLINIGKTPIKVLDTNNDSGSGGRDAVVSDNYIKNYGLCFPGCTAFLSANGYSSAYIFSKTSRNKNVIISNNTVISDVADGSSVGFIMSMNIDNLVITGNTYTVLNQIEAIDDYINSWGNGVFSNNTFDFNGRLLSYQTYGKVIINGNILNGASLHCDAISQETEKSKIVITNNIIDTKLTTLPNQGWGIKAMRCNSLVSGNVVKCDAQLIEPSTEAATGYNPFNVYIDSTVDNNIIIYSNGIKYTRSIAGNTLWPSYYKGLFGNAVIENTGIIAYLSDKYDGGGGAPYNYRKRLPYISSGTTRPTGIPIGFSHFDTSLSPARTIWFAGNNTWVDATGATV